MGVFCHNPGSTLGWRFQLDCYAPAYLTTVALFYVFSVFITTLVLLAHPTRSEQLTRKKFMINDLEGVTLR